MSEKPFRKKTDDQENKPFKPSAQLNISEDKNVNYAASLLKEINDNSGGKGKLAGKFQRAVHNMENQQLIEIAGYLGRIIEDNQADTSLLESLLDDVLEKIEGSLG